LKGGNKNMWSLKRQKKAQTLNIITSTVIGFMILIFMIFAVLFGIAKLNPSSFFTAGSADANATTNLQSNLTSGVSQFGAYIPTVMIVLAVVLVLSAIVLLVLYVRRMQMGAGGGGGGL
jgi:hypothetical protein